MADIPISAGAYPVPVTSEVKKLKLEMEIGEFQSRIARIKQDITDLESIKLKGLKGTLKMLEASLKHKQDELDNIGAIEVSKTEGK